LGVLLAAGWLQRASLQRTWRRATGPAPAPILAVLPLEPVGGEPGESLFADGMTQDLISRLGHTPGLRVVGRAGVGRQRGRPLDEVAHDLDASALVTGIVRRSDARVEMSLELFAASDRASIWADDFAGRLSEMERLQDGASTAIAKVLGIDATPASTRDVDPSAYDQYVRGLDALARQRPGEAIDFFEQAIAADAGFARAQAHLVQAIHALAVEEGIPDDPSRTARMRAAAERARELNPDLAQAHLAMGLASPTVDEAVASLNRAIELDPSYGAALQALGDEVRDFDPERAIAFYGRALAADPFLDTARVSHAVALLLLNRWGLARAELLRARFEHAPEWSHGMFGILGVAQGKYGDALFDLDRASEFRDRPFFLAQYAATLATARRTGEALAMATTLTERFPGLCEGQALRAGLLADQGERAEARARVQPLLAGADGAAVRGSSLRCAALAAAAIGDAAQLAATLDRIASREDWVRSWAFARFGLSGRLALMGHFYPWTKVVEHPDVVASRERMDAANARFHDIIKARLGRIAYQ
jgi:TolB-like protein